MTNNQAPMTAAICELVISMKGAGTGHVGGALGRPIGITKQ